MLPFLITSDDVTDWLAGDGARIAAIVAFAVVADFALHRIIPRALWVAVERQMQGKDEEEIQKRVNTLASVFTASGRVIIGLVALLTLLPLAGISIGPLLAGVGIIGLAVGFGAQSLVKDVISGLFILLDNQYSKGDVVTLSGISGLVEEVGIRRTVLRDLDGIVHYIPNGQIAVASNFTQEYSRVNLNVGVSYSEDLDQVMRVIDRVGEEMAADPQWAPAIISPPKSLRVDNLGDSGIDIKVVGDTKPIKQWEVMGELRKRIKKAFDDEGIEIPYPHRVIVTRGAKATDIPDTKSASPEVWVAGGGDYHFEEWCGINALFLTFISSSSSTHLREPLDGANAIGYGRGAGSTSVDLSSSGEVGSSVMPGTPSTLGRHFPFDPRRLHRRAI